MQKAAPAQQLLPCTLLLLASSCGPGPHASDDLRPRFVDVAAEAGIDAVTTCGSPERWYIPESNGTGAAWLDYDLDGDVDLFIGDGAKLAYHDGGKRLEVVERGRTRLYRNDGDWSFTDVTEAAGAGRSEWVNGIATGDIEGDGDLDIYLACFGPDVLLVNEGGRFSEQTDAAGLGNDRWGASATFGDVDGDGNLDLFVANYVQFDLSAPPKGGERMLYEGVEIGWGPEGEAEPGVNPGEFNLFYRGNGDGTFREATAQAGLALDDPLCSYAAVFTDVDGDGDADLCVANDAEPSNLFINTGDGTFEEQGLARGFALNAEGQPTAAMGLAIADYDQDGDQDVLRTNFDFQTNCLHVNDGHGHYKDLAGAAGMAEPSLKVLGWGCAFLDAECDGDLDFLVANGHVLPQATAVGMNGWLQQSQCFSAARDSAGMITYTDVSAASPGLAPLRSARGLALADVDDDGDLDAVIVDIDAPPRLLRNDSRRAGHWLRVQTIGEKSNRDGFGALVTVRAGGREWVREVRSTDGLFSAHDPRAHFGLGEAGAIEEVEVRWPSGAVQKVTQAPLDSTIVIRESDA